MNVLLHEVNIRLDKTEERDNELEEKWIKIIQTKAQREKRVKYKKEWGPSNHEIKSSNQTYVRFESQKERNKRLGQKRLSDLNFHIWIKKYSTQILEF